LELLARTSAEQTNNQVSDKKTQGNEWNNIKSERGQYNKAMEKQMTIHGK